MDFGLNALGWPMTYNWAKQTNPLLLYTSHIMYDTPPILFIISTIFNMLLK